MLTSILDNVHQFAFFMDRIIVILLKLIFHFGNFSSRE